MQIDPIVEEVRIIRLTIEEESHFDFKEIFERAKEKEARIDQVMIDNPIKTNKEEVMA
ncbi:MAG: hypothetical protein HY960_07650 [Ignavibacteriae bacterium]|nr:hypothetical protein [Ignavibacteriota bacterium]